MTVYQPADFIQRMNFVISFNLLCTCVRTHRLWKPPVGLLTPSRECPAPRGSSTAASSEMPKSVSLITPLSLYKKLPGLMSR